MGVIYASPTELLLPNFFYFVLLKCHNLIHPPVRKGNPLERDLPPQTTTTPQFPTINLSRMVGAPRTTSCIHMALKLPLMAIKRLECFWMNCVKAMVQVSVLTATFNLLERMNDLWSGCLALLQFQSSTYY